MTQKACESKILASVRLRNPTITSKSCLPHSTISRLSSILIFPPKACFSTHPMTSWVSPALCLWGHYFHPRLWLQHTLGYKGNSPRSPAPGDSLYEQAIGGVTPVKFVVFHGKEQFFLCPESKMSSQGRPQVGNLAWEDKKVCVSICPTLQGQGLCADSTQQAGVWRKVGRLEISSRGPAGPCATQHYLMSHSLAVPPYWSFTQALLLC
jgi:hypothetical protein